MPVDFSGKYVPRDYEDLYKYYISGDGDSLAKVLIRRYLPGETRETREDVLHDVYTRMLAKDILKVFDPAKSNFGGVIFFVTRTVCVNYLKRKTHDPITYLKSATLEESPTEATISKPGIMYLDRMEAEPGPDPISSVDAQRRLEAIREEMKWEPNAKRRARNTRIHRVMNLLLQGYNVKECAEREGVTMATVTNWLGYLRDLAEGLDELERAATN